MGCVSEASAPVLASLAAEAAPPGGPPAPAAPAAELPLGALVLGRADVGPRGDLANRRRGLRQRAVLPDVQPDVAADDAHVPVGHLERVTAPDLVDLGLPQRKDDSPRVVADDRLGQLARLAELRVDGPALSDVHYLPDQ